MPTPAAELAATGRSTSRSSSATAEIEEVERQAARASLFCQAGTRMF
jgi:hypothetical protein